MLHWFDIKYAFRLLAKTPGFTALTILVLAGGLAISIYTFAVLDTMLYKALPIADGESVVRILGRQERRDVAIGAYELAELRGDVRSLGGIGAYSDEQALLTDQDASRSIYTTRAEWNVFEFARARPMLGRGFVRDDNIDGAEPVAVLGYAIWRAAFAADPDIVDRVVRINGKPTRIVGVMPKGFSFPIAAEMWLPLARKDLAPTAYSTTSLNAYARLQPGWSIEEASAEVDALLRRVQQLQKANTEHEMLDGAFVASFQFAQTGSDGTFVFAVLNVVSLFILLLACVNVGNMLLARTNERIREIAVRLALGAPRWRLMAQMMLESVIICLVGGALALVLAGWGLKATNRFLNSTFEGNLPFWWNWGLDGGTVFAAGLFVVFAIVLVSALPTFSATRVNENALLRDGTRGARGRTSGRISRGLVIVEIVLISVVMLVGSAMAIVAYRAAHVDFGMDTTNLLTMPVDLPATTYDTPDEQRLFWQRLLAELRRSPEIEAAMIESEQGETAFAIDDAEYNDVRDYPTAALVMTSESPQQIGTALVEGRNFDTRDSATGLKTVVVSDSLARTAWPGESALGRRVRLVTDGKVTESRTVVGVVSDVKRGDLINTTRTSFAALYVPMPQAVSAGAGVLARHRGNERASRGALNQAVQSLDAYVMPGPISSYADMQRKLTLMATTMTDLFIRCGIFAILLAMTGIYGLSSNAVVQRTHEIGLRRAIGASDGAIVALFLGQGTRQLTTGLAISAVISIAVLFVISKVVGVNAVTLTLVGVAVAGAVSALVLTAIYISTRRAVLHEPGVSLRHD